MDHESFDRLARLLGSAGSRRAALGALLGSGLAGTLAAAEAAKKHRNKKRKRGKKRNGSAAVTAQAVDCLSPGPSSNISGCNFNDDDFSGDDLSSSRMVGTRFRNAELEGTDLSSSNMKDATFRGANLCGADLRSSTLRNVDFRGFGPNQGSGRQTDLTLADLRSSGGCNSIKTNGRTIFCGTRMCNGTIRNDDCADGPASDFCCTPCADGEECINNQCVLPVCDGAVGFEDCTCFNPLAGGDPVCVNPQGSCNSTCTLDNPSCPEGTVCTLSPCCALPEGTGVCNPPCENPDDCTCASGATVCALPDFVRCGSIGSGLRRSSASPQVPAGR